jgi:hypothetical protein
MFGTTGNHDAGRDDGVLGVFAVGGAALRRTEFPTQIEVIEETTMARTHHGKNVHNGQLSIPPD